MFTTMSNLLCHIGDKLDFLTASHKRIYKFVMDLIPNDWKHLLKTETSQKKNTF